MNDFGSLLNTICFLGSKPNRSKEESITYYELLRYAATLARLNREAAEAEILRREETNS